MTLPAVFLDRPFAHRALHDITMGRAENSTKSVAAAIAAGYAIEIDLQLSSGSVPMVFHDYDLGCLAEATGPVAQRTAIELGAIALRHDGGGIPTLSQFLYQVPLLIEFKDQDGQMGRNLGSLGEAAAKTLRQYTGPFAVMSFNPHAVDELRHLLPDAPRCIVTDTYSDRDWPTLPASVYDHLRNISDYTPTGSSFISHNQSDLDAAPVAKIEARVRKVADNITFEGYLA